MFRKVWQCGHCGSVYKEKAVAIECCGGMEELSYQCDSCGALYNNKPKGKCFECGG